MKCEDIFHPACMIQANTRKTPKCIHVSIPTDGDDSSIAEKLTESPEPEVEMKILRVENYFLKQLLSECQSKNKVLLHNNELLVEKIMRLEKDNTSQDKQSKKNEVNNRFQRSRQPSPHALNTDGKSQGKQENTVDSNSAGTQSIVHKQSAKELRNMREDTEEHPQNDTSKHNLKFQKENINENSGAMNLRMSEVWTEVKNKKQTRKARNSLICKGNESSQKNIKIKGAVKRKWLYIGRISGKEVKEDDIAEYLRDTKKCEGAIIKKLDTKDAGNIDIILLSEHWLKEEQSELVELNGYKISSIYCRQIMKCGGTLVAVHDRWKSSEITEVVKLSREKDVEMAAVHIPAINTIIVALYRAPTGDFSKFMEILTEALNIISNKYSKEKVIIGGDFNIDFLKRNRESMLITNLMFSYGLKGKATTPSRVTKQSANCIDNMFTNDQDESTLITSEIHMSDHQAQLLKIKKTKTTTSLEKETIKKRLFKEENIQQIKQELSKIDWENFLASKDAKVGFTEFHNYFMSILDKWAPVKERVLLQCNQKNKIFKTRRIQEMKNKLDALQVIMSVKKDQESQTIYKKYKDIFNKEVENTLRENNKNLIEKANNKSKAMWNIIKNKKKRKFI
ncbi:uncharacterized protein LOC123681119 [Harmonia axyridis]|uniref:uncharacterized protein LOC123681119 n=1 Tax=Harmonia axyridis TaxID=115357 RepID=UPI001E279C59|nr:uncharacterized protein LOC123681119 [Harmonia axyridis]